MTPRPPVLSCSDVRISYFDQTVVDGISLEVNRGELVTIIGQNASGKSTLLRAFCNLKPIDAGAIKEATDAADPLEDPPGVLV